MQKLIAIDQGERGGVVMRQLSENGGDSIATRMWGWGGRVTGIIFFKKWERLEFSSKQMEEKDMSSRALVGFFVGKGDGTPLPL